MKLKSILSESNQIVEAGKLKLPLAKLTPLAKNCLYDVIEQFGEDSFSTIGGYNYRNIAGSDTLSEHAYGNALDLHPKNGDKTIGDRVQQCLLQNRSALQISSIIWNRKIWSPRKNYAERTYTGDNPHTDHVHVDFIRGGSNSNPERVASTNIEINTYIKNLIYAYYDISTKNPAKYFSKFRSWNPLDPGIGDNEEGAANKLIGRFFKIYEPKLIKYEQLPTITIQDKDNIQTLRSLIDKLTNAILNGKSTNFIVRFYVYNKNTDQYEIKELNFKWDYL